MLRKLFLNRLVITWVFLGMFRGFLIGPVCNVRVAVNNGDFLLVASSTSGDSDFFQESVNDRSGAAQMRFQVLDFLSVSVPFVPAKEGIAFPMPLCSFFLSNTFYIFLTSLAP